VQIVMATNDDPSTDTHQALLTEHFGFHPRVFIDALVYAANEHLYSIGGQFEEFAKKQLKAACRRAAKKAKERGRAQISSSRDTGTGESSSSLAKMTPTQIEAEAEKGVHGVLTLMENALDHIFDLLELYCLKAVFGVRPSQASAMTLKHHRGLDLRSAAERGLGKEALADDNEYLALNKYESLLRERIENAKRRRHALRLANIAAMRGLLRANKITDAFAVLTTHDANERAPTINSSTPQFARAVRSDVQSLVQALDALAKTDPLGASLLTSSATNETNDEERLAIIRASGVSEKEKRSWERGREAYINWEMDRIIRNVRTRAAGNETLAGDVTGTTSIMPREAHITSTARPSLGVAIGAKRRRTTGRMSVAEEQEQDEGHQAAQVGTLNDIERMANLLSR
jgi:kinetochore protein Mis12/MTW1